MKEAEFHDLAEWAEQAPDQSQRELRRAVHTVLAAIAQEERLRASMIIKGGILLAVRYKSSRFTRDIDFSTSLSLKNINANEVRLRLDAALIVAVNALDYDLDCRVQGCRVIPPNRPEASFPSIEIKIAYAPKGSPRHKRLLLGQCPHVLSIDYSLNEDVSNVEHFSIGLNQSITAYGFPDLVSEKFRALLQQVERNRYRRQDVYDLAFLSELPRSREEERLILESLLRKSRARNIEPTRDSLNNAEVKRRAAADYHTLRDEVQGDLPDFESAYARVVAFFRGLPWGGD